MNWISDYLDDKKKKTTKKKTKQKQNNPPAPRPPPPPPPPPPKKKKKKKKKSCCLILHVRFYKGNARVPQGSVLGPPTIFLIYVNDILKSLLSLTILFADDSSLFYSTSSLAYTEGIINHSLRLQVAWAKQLLIKFNHLKTQATLFTLEHFPNLIFNDTQIKFVEDHMHLGLMFSNNGKWPKRIDDILNSTAKVVAIIRKLEFTLSKIALNPIYVSYV